MSNINIDTLIAELGASKILELNSQLQQKKNALRKELKEMGILPRGKENTFDHYKYFSEAQYKDLFTGLFSKHGLEMSVNELDYFAFDGTEKQANGRMVKLEFILTDIDTGFFESSVITGEGIDKGDKAGYKADTGALKYYLADTFMVATGEDAEKESLNAKMVRKASPKQISLLKSKYTGENMTKLLEKNGLQQIEDMTLDKASEIISKLKGGE